MLAAFLSGTIGGVRAIDRVVDEDIAVALEGGAFTSSLSMLFELQLIDIMITSELAAATTNTTIVDLAGLLIPSAHF